MEALSRSIRQPLPITERKQAREALQEKERLLSESQRIGHVGSWSYDIAADSLQYSDEMYRLLDISPEEFQHNWEAFLRLIYSLDRPLVAKCMEDIRTGSQAHELEFRIFRKNGELSYLRCKGAVTSDVAGRPLRFIGTVQDVTERKLAEERLRFLAEAGEVLTSSLDYQSRLETIARLVVPYLADWCVVDDLDDDVLRRAAVVHRDPSRQAAAAALRRRYPSVAVDGAAI